MCVLVMAIILAAGLQRNGGADGDFFTYLFSVHPVSKFVKIKTGITEMVLPVI